MKRAAVGAALFFFFFAGPECKTVLAGTEGVKAREEDQSEELKKELTAELDFSEIQNMLDEMLGEDSFSFQEAFEKLLNGENGISEEAVREFLRGLLFSGLEQEKALFMKLILRCWQILLLFLKADRLGRSAFILYIF